MTRRLVAASLLLILGMAGASGRSTVQPLRPVVYVMPIQGMIDLGLAPFLTRTLREAQEAGAAAVVLDINTFGGRVDAAVAMRDALMTDDVGILQHARFCVPRDGEGYCLDDNARGLQLAALLDEEGVEDRALVRALTARYLAFTEYAYDAQRARFRNFLSYERHWLEWLAAIQRSAAGVFAPVGSNGFYQRNATMAAFDQQPVEASAMVSACVDAQRAESTLSFLLALMALRAAQRADAGVPASRMVTH